MPSTQWKCRARKYKMRRIFTFNYLRGARRGSLILDGTSASGRNLNGHEAANISVISYITVRLQKSAFLDERQLRPRGLRNITRSCMVARGTRLHPAHGTYRWVFLHVFTGHHGCVVEHVHCGARKRQNCVITSVCDHISV